MLLIEQRLTQLEQDSEWWAEWKKKGASKNVEQENGALNDEEELEGAVGGTLENSLNESI